MNAIQAALLGLIQGLGEFLPISSSGHLLLAEQLMGIDTAGGAYMMLTILLHVGTLIPVIIVFWQEWWGMISHPLQNRKLWGMLIVASLPALIVHVLDLDESFESGWFLGVSFLITAVLLLILEAASGRKDKPGKNRPGWLNAIVMGCFQAVALLPGVSRSGSSITGGVVSGLDRKAAAKFSFMMSAPAIAGSLLLEGKDAIKNGTFKSIELVPTLIGVIVACVTGYLAIRFMLKLISKVSMGWFAVYVALIGLVYLVMQLSGNASVAPFALPTATPTATPAPADAVGSLLTMFM